MRKILFRFPAYYYLNPISLICAAGILYMRYYEWISTFKKVAEYEYYNVTYSNPYINLVIGTCFLIVLVVLNVLLYPYVFDAIIKFVVRYIGPSRLMKFFIRRTVSVYQYEIDRGDIYTHHTVEYDRNGYPVALIPQYSLAKSRAFEEAQVTAATSIFALILIYTGVLCLFLSGWMFSAVIGWLFAWKFNSGKKVNTGIKS
ncbi:hypothetical protein ABPH35_00585 [Streptococcus sp. ZJ93]|uniref:hypothetical protein n=1 Tax=Streptococcus handemini TaxID=3161188 RepID=UPI0032EAF3CF